MPSESEPDKAYTVSLTADGAYRCHCWPFLRTRQPCKHIEQVLAGNVQPEGADTTPEPAIEFWHVREVTPVLDEGRVMKCHAPLLPIGNEHFLLTLLYDLARYGVRWTTLLERYHLPRTLSRARVEAYIQAHGRLIYGPWQEGQGYVGFTLCPVEAPLAE
uniref:SWIM-type domain-containing protein n=1 Tax=Fundidesulfovibrio putealis TaxID=270496 RepID=A0A7C4AGJ1_9BACT